MTEESEDTKRQLTPEELETRKQNLIRFYKDQIEFLTPQKNYEELITELEELRTRRMYAQMKQAEMMAPDLEEDKSQPKMPEIPTDKVEIKPRTLKK